MKRSLRSEYLLNPKYLFISNISFMEPLQFSLSKMKKSIFFFACINFVVYVLLFFLFRLLGLLHVSGLRMLNYITLTFISCYQIHRWIKKGGGYVPFLQAYSAALITGTLSF